MKKSSFIVSGKEISWWTYEYSLMPTLAKAVKSSVIVALHMILCDEGHFEIIYLIYFWNLF